MSSFQFSMWDSSRWLSSSSVRGIFQFSMWDSFLVKLPKTLEFSSFNSLCEIQVKRAIDEAFLDYAFNSLCEIQQLAVELFADCSYYLSILYVRFAKQVVLENVNNMSFQFSMWDSIVGERGRGKGAITFNSLCEIPFALKWYHSNSISFNSLCEILLSKSGAQPTSCLNFQFSMWDSRPYTKSCVTLLTTFNSLCEILFWNKNDPPKEIKIFQFSMWDSSSHLYGICIRSRRLSILYVRFLVFIPNVRGDIVEPFNSLCEIR